MLMDLDICYGPYLALRAPLDEDGDNALRRLGSRTLPPLILG